MRNILYSGLALLALAFGGCGYEDYIEGTVKKEHGRTAGITESSGALFGNESVKMGDPGYVLEVDTKEGRYVFEVKDIDKMKRGNTVRGLAVAIKPEEEEKGVKGTRIRFARSHSGGPGYANFGNDRVGVVYSDGIEVLD